MLNTLKTKYILESGSGNLNEDTIVLEKNLFGVFDGSTSLDNKTFNNGKTGGLIASSTAGSVFAKNGHSLVKLARGANRAIYNQMLNHGVNLSKKENLWSTSAAVVRIKKNKIEWVQTGDCCIILIYHDNSFKNLVEKDDHDYETLTMWKTVIKKQFADFNKPESNKNESVKNKQPITQQPEIKISKILRDQIKKIRSGMNENYGVLNGEKEAYNFLNHGYEPLNRVKEILLFTDGLSIPKKTPEKSKQFNDLIQDYLSLGLNSLKDKIRVMENKDPDCTIYPRFKCHDDIAAISIKTL